MKYILCIPQERNSIKMQNLSDAATIKRIMSRHGFNMSKALGQNFIIDAEICPRIAESGGVTSETGVLEIGPGIGVLTQQLASRAKKVVAVELDKRLPAVLADTLTDFDNVTIINADVLEIDLHALLREHFGGMDVVVCANLPYYVTSPIVMRLLESKLPVKAVTVMVQKEAGERICADLPSRKSGAVTVAVRWYSEPEMLFEVSRDAFLPPPDVTSAVIRLNVRESPPCKVKNEEMFFKTVKAAFSQRRKTLQNCLSSFFGMDKTKIAEIIAAAGLMPAARAEELRMEDFAAVADSILQEMKHAEKG